MPYVKAARRTTRGAIRRKVAPYTTSAKASQSKALVPMYRGPTKFAVSRVPFDRRVIENPTVGLGSAARTRLRTYFHYNATVSAAGQWTGYLKPFSCDDPCGSLGTLEPNLYDQWKAMYGRYTVISAKVRVGVAPTGVSGATYINASYDFVGWPSIDNTAKTSVQDASSQPYAKETVMTVGGDCKWLTFYLDNKKQLGRWGPLDPEVQGATTSADPTEQIYLNLFSQSSYVSAAPNPITLFVEIVQDVWFDQRKSVNDVVE